MRDPLSLVSHWFVTGTTAADAGTLSKYEGHCGGAGPWLMEVVALPAGAGLELAVLLPLSFCWPVADAASMPGLVGSGPMLSRFP